MTRKDHPFREKYCVKEDYSLSSVMERHSTWSQNKNQDMHLNGNIVKWIGQKKPLRAIYVYTYIHIHVHTQKSHT